MSGKPRNLSLGSEGFLKKENLSFLRGSGKREKGWSMRRPWERIAAAGGPEPGRMWSATFCAPDYSTDRREHTLVGIERADVEGASLGAADALEPGEDGRRAIEGIGDDGRACGAVGSPAGDSPEEESDLAALTGAKKHEASILEATPARIACSGGRRQRMAASDKVMAPELLQGARGRLVQAEAPACSAGMPPASLTHRKGSLRKARSASPSRKMKLKRRVQNKMPLNPSWRVSIRAAFQELREMRPKRSEFTADELYRYICTHHQRLRPRRGSSNPRCILRFWFTTALLGMTKPSTSPYAPVGSLILLEESDWAPKRRTPSATCEEKSSGTAALKAVDFSNRIDGSEDESDDKHYCTCGSPVVTVAQAVQRPAQLQMWFNLVRQAFETMHKTDRRRVDFSIVEIRTAVATLIKLVRFTIPSCFESHIAQVLESGLVYAKSPRPNAPPNSWVCYNWTYNPLDQ